LPGGLVPALSVVPASTMVLPAKAELSTVRIVLPLPICATAKDEVVKGEDVGAVEGERRAMSNRLAVVLATSGRLGLTG
jgi:hypothetical protein